VQGGQHNNNVDQPQCQVCHKVGHTTDRCWYSYEEGYVPAQRHTTVAATSSYTMDPNWYVDLGATYYITSELDKLAIQDKYNGGEKVHTTSGAGMKISHAGKSFIHRPTCNLQLCNILHVPKATKNLTYVHCFTLDNNVFFEIHPWFFLIKDWAMRNTLIKGRCHDGLYPILVSPTTKFSFAVNKSSLTRWHNRLGHPTFQIVQSVLKDFNLPFVQELNKGLVCGPC
jgi:hypothetical protein